MVLRKSIGASLVENLIIIGLVSVASIAILTTFGGTIHNVIANSHVKVKTFDPFGAAKPQIAYGEISEIRQVSDDVFELVVEGEPIKISKTDLLTLGEIAFETTGSSGALDGSGIQDLENVVALADTESEEAVTINLNGRSVSVPKKIVDKVIKIFNSQTSIENSPLIKAITVAVEDGSLTITDDMASQIEEAIEQQSEDEVSSESEEQPDSVNGVPLVDGSATLPLPDPIPITMPPSLLDLQNNVFQSTGSTSGIDIGTTGITIGDKFYPISPNIMNRLNTIFPSIGADDL